MLRRLRRPVAVLAPLVLLGALAGCGEEKTVGGGGGDRLDAVEISGEFGEAPDVEWKDRMNAGKAQTEVLEEGDGAEVASEGSVLVNYWVGNGFTQSPVLDTFGEEPALAFTVGAEVPQPTAQDERSVAKYLIDSFVAAQVEAGDTVGTRKVVTTTSADVVGYGGGGLGIGNADGLLIVLDVAAVPLERPQGAAKPKPAWAPSIVVQKQRPAALDFDGVPDPSGSLQTAVLIEGEGAQVAKGDTIVVNYLGQVPGFTEPFDESYSKQPFTTPIGAGAVVKGWDQGLVGVTVGSRVVLQIPPALAYGDQKDNPSIPPGSTLYFVVDVLAAA